MRAARITKKAQRIVMGRFFIALLSLDGGQQAAAVSWNQGALLLGALKAHGPSDKSCVGR